MKKITRLSLLLFTVAVVPAQGGTISAGDAFIIPDEVLLAPPKPFPTHTEILPVHMENLRGGDQAFDYNGGKIHHVMGALPGSIHDINGTHIVVGSLGTTPSGAEEHLTLVTYKWSSAGERNFFTVLVEDTVAPDTNVGTFLVTLQQIKFKIAQHLRKENHLEPEEELGDTRLPAFVSELSPQPVLSVLLEGEMDLE